MYVLHVGGVIMIQCILKITAAAAAAPTLTPTLSLHPVTQHFLDSHTQIMVTLPPSDSMCVLFVLQISF